MLKGFISKSLAEQIKCRVREFLREPSAFFWVIFMPIVWMVALGFAFSDPKPESYGVGVATESLTAKPLSELHAALSSAPQLKLHTAPEAELLSLFQRGDIVMVVANAHDGLRFRLDPVNPVAQRARSYVDGILQQKAGRIDPLRTESEAIQALGGRYVDFLVPGLLGLSIMTSSLFGVGMTIVSNRRENLLKRYCATPMRSYEYVLSHIVGRLLVLTVEFVAILTAGMLIFKFRVFGSLGLYFLTAGFGAAAFSAIAILIASRTKSMTTISGLTNLLSLPMMMLSGVFFSKANFPDWLRRGADLLPLSALNDALRKIALEGQGFNAIVPELVLLAGVTIVATVAAKGLFKWY